MKRSNFALLSWAVLAALLLTTPAALGAPAGEPLAVTNARHHRALSWALGDTWYPGAILGAVKDALLGNDQGSSPSSPSSSSPASSQQQPSYSPSYSPSYDGAETPDNSQSKGANSDEAAPASSPGSSSPQQQQQPAQQQPASDSSAPGYYASQAKPSSSSSSSSPSPASAPSTSSSSPSPSPSTNSSKVDPANVDQVKQALETLEANKKPNGTTSGTNGGKLGSSVPASTLGASMPAPVPAVNGTRSGNAGNGTAKGEAIDPANVDQVTKALQNINAKGASTNATNPSPRISSSPLPSPANATNTTNSSTKSPIKPHRRALSALPTTAASASATTVAAHHARRSAARRQLRGFAGTSDGSGTADLSSNILGTVDQQVQQALSNSGVGGSSRQGNVALPAGTQQQQYVPQQQPQQQQQQQQQQYVPQAQQQAQQQGGLNSEQQDALSLHNSFRARHGSPALTYSTDLENSARAWAQQLANECGFRHSGPGENLASGYNSWGEVVKAWYDEISMYNFNAPGFSHETGHFTQVVWAATTTVGCATARSSSCWEGTIFACHYRPYGNVNSAQYFRDNVRQPVASS